MDNTTFVVNSKKLKKKTNKFENFYLGGEGYVTCICFKNKDP